MVIGAQTVALVATSGGREMDILVAKIASVGTLISAANAIVYSIVRMD